MPQARIPFDWHAPKLEYLLTVTQFTQDQCDKITSPVLRACMSQMGYNRNSPKEVVCSRGSPSGEQEQDGPNDAY
jgi:hypothetical protein